MSLSAYSFLVSGKLLILTAWSMAVIADESQICLILTYSNPYPNGFLDIYDSVMSDLIGTMHCVTGSLSYSYPQGTNTLKSQFD